MNKRPSERTWPSFSSVSRIRRQVARVSPVSRATSLSVSAGLSRENTWITAMPRSSERRVWLRSVDAAVVPTGRLYNPAAMRTTVCRANKPGSEPNDADRQTTEGSFPRRHSEPVEDEVGGALADHDRGGMRVRRGHEGITEASATRSPSTP